MDLTPTAQEGVTAAASTKAAPFLRDIWYFALLSRDLKPGNVINKTQKKYKARQG